jgi:hypothetical protein
MREGGSLLIIFLIIVAISGGGIYQNIGQNKLCYSTEGEIIEKSNDEGILILYVKLEYNGEINYYRVFVGPEAYDNYVVGEIYIEETCELSRYHEIQGIIDDLLEWGIIEDAYN